MKFRILRDERESQPLERIQTDGVQDHPFLALVGGEETLSLLFMPGQLTPSEEEGPLEIQLSRQALLDNWEALTRWVETGLWTGWEKATEDTNQVLRKLWWDCP